MSERLEAITPAFLRQHPLPEAGDSKSARGTTLVVGGSPGTPGAVVLAGLAALRVGAGVLTLAVPHAVAIPLAVAVPESGVTSWEDDDPDFAALHTRVEASSSVLLGPGLDDVELTRRLIEEVIDCLPPDCSLVLDAYALGVLPDLRARVGKAEGRLVLTPNHAEAARLLDTELSQIELQEDAAIATRITDTWAATTIYQGIVATPGCSSRTVGTGHGGLGTSGSGDVLAGAVSGILARGADLHRAGCWATYLHAAAGDRLAARIGRLGFRASELLDELPRILSELDT
jgi:hydroxyethylthiazole kinase-like uncharacterized protein yjeF